MLYFANQKRVGDKVIYQPWEIRMNCGSSHQVIVGDGRVALEGCTARRLRNESTFVAAREAIEERLADHVRFRAWLRNRMKEVLAPPRVSEKPVFEGGGWV